jgi:hypothetical protein
VLYNYRAKCLAGEERRPCLCRGERCKGFIEKEIAPISRDEVGAWLGGTHARI